MTVCSMGLIVSAIISRAIVTSQHQQQQKPLKPSMSTRTWFTHVLPVGLSAAATMTLGNTAYLHLGVGFIQMLKAMSPIFTMAALVATGLEKPNLKLISSVCIIAAGTSIAAYGETKLSLLGLLIVVAGEVCEAGRLVVTQHLLQQLQFGTMEGIMYLVSSNKQAKKHLRCGNCKMAARFEPTKHSI